MGQAEQVIADTKREQKARGAWVGFVELAEDPDDLDRVKVRIPGLHPPGIPEEQLPWAQVNCLFGGVEDTGSSGGITEGATCVVIHEQEMMLRPIIIGFLAKQTSKDWHYGRQGDETGGDWTPQADGKSEIPLERQGQAGRNRISVFKTMKGSTIIVEEKDGAEFTRIIDRAGQVIEMSSPVTVAANQKNAGRRKERNAITGDQLPYSDIQTKASIRIVDLAGQEVKLESGQNLEKIQVLNQKRDGSKQQQLFLDLTSGSEKLLLQDSKGSKIEMEGVNGDVTTNAFRDEKPNITRDRDATVGRDDKVSIGGKRDVSVTSDDKLTVSGKRDTTIQGDLTENITGKHEETVTGDRKITSQGKVEISGVTEAKLAAGTVEVKLTPSGVEVTAPQAQVNCTGPVTVAGNPINLN